jgi:hypothetical protein
METTKQVVVDENLISYCGFYCGACPKFLKEHIWPESTLDG